MAAAGMAATHGGGGHFGGGGSHASGSHAGNRGGVAYHGGSHGGGWHGGGGISGRRWEPREQVLTAETTAAMHVAATTVADGMAAATTGADGMGRQGADGMAAAPTITPAGVTTRTGGVITRTAGVYPYGWGWGGAPYYSSWGWGGGPSVYVVAGDGDGYVDTAGYNGGWDDLSADPSSYERVSEENTDVRDEPLPQPAGYRARMRFKVTPADAAVYVDDKYLGAGEELAADARGIVTIPGAHTITVARPGYKTKTIRVNARIVTPVDVVVALER